MCQTYEYNLYLSVSSDLDSDRCFSLSKNLLYRVFRSVSESRSFDERPYVRSVFNCFSVMFANDSSELCDKRCLVLLMASQLSRRDALCLSLDTRTFDEWSMAGVTSSAGLDSRRGDENDGDARMLSADVR